MKGLSILRFSVCSLLMLVAAVTATAATAEGARVNARSFVSGLNGLEQNPLAFALTAEGKTVPAFRP